MSLVLGLDMGGTATRAVLVSTAGVRYGAGLAGPGNPFAHPPERVAATMADALGQALAGHDPGRVRLGLIGMAGGARLAEPAVATLFERAWQQTGLRCPMRVIGDTEVAFAAGTAEPDGTVLIAGTGAIAARIEQHRMTHSVGGHGWLLGDEGAGYWLGREAVRAVLAVADRRLAPGILTGTVTDRLNAEAPADTATYHTEAERILAAVDHTHPVRLARLAPLVSQAAQAGDPTAVAIVARAARHLRRLVTAAREPAEQGPIVLAGSVVAPGTPVDAALRAELTLDRPVPVYPAGDGAAGAAWLAARSVAADSGQRIDPVALHQAILSRPATG